MFKEASKEAVEMPFWKRGGFFWEPLDVGRSLGLVTMGAMKFHMPKTILRVLGEDLLSIRGYEEPGGPLRLSAMFYNRDGSLMARIVYNEWQPAIDNFDITTEAQTTPIQ